MLLAAAPAARAGDESPRGTPLTLKDLYAGRSFTKGIPSWSWRPGHAELVRTTRKKMGGKRPHAVLIGMDPKSGKTHDILDLSRLDELVVGKGGSMGGIGRGGAPRHKWAADGNALCAVVKGDLVWVDLRRDTRRRLTETKERLVDLNLAPNGSYVSFSRGNELWVVSTKKGKPYPLTSGGTKTLLNATLDWVYPEELGFRTAAWWSPTAKHLAYLQMDQSSVPVYRVPGLLPMRSGGREMFYPKAGDPNPKVRIGVVSVKGGKTVWMDVGDPAPEYVARVTWVPGGKTLYVITLDRAQRHLRIHVCDPKTGKSRVVYEERDDAWIATPPQPRWVSDTAFLWRRQDACTRWFLADRVTGGKRLVMTPLTAPGIDATDLVHYGAKKGETTLYGGIVHGEVTAGLFEGVPGAGRIQRSPLAPDAGTWTTARADESGTYALVSTSSATVPTRTDLVRVADGKVLREIGSAHSERLDALALAVPEYGHIPVEGLGRINWRLWKPADFDPEKKYGLLVQVYAGPGSRMVANRWGRGPLLQTLLTQRGFLVLQADGRGSGGQGRDFMKCVQGRLGILELEDQVRAVKEITARPYVDEARVGIWGWSYGGTMACNALTMRSDVFRAGVAVASVTDWRLYDTIYTERYMGTPAENPEGYQETAASTHAKKMTGRLLLMHGMGDDNVHAQNTMRLIEAFLRAKNLNYDAMIYPRRGHGIGGASLDVYTRLVHHFETHLK